HDSGAGTDQNTDGDRAEGTDPSSVRFASHHDSVIGTSVSLGHDSCNRRSTESMSLSGALNTAHAVTGWLFAVSEYTESDVHASSFSETGEYTRRLTASLRCGANEFAPHARGA